MHEDIIRKLQRQKNRNNPTVGIVFLVIFFVLGCLVSLIIGFPMLMILWIIVCVSIVWSIVWNKKKQERLIDLFKSGKFIVVETTIIDFKVSTGDDFKSILGYYIISFDGDKTYKSNLLEHAFLSCDGVDDFNINEYKRYSVLKSHNGKSFKIGDKISVYLDPDNPKNYFVNC